MPQSAADAVARVIADLPNIAPPMVPRRRSKWHHKPKWQRLQEERAAAEPATNLLALTWNGASSPPLSPPRPPTSLRMRRSPLPSILHSVAASARRARAAATPLSEVVPLSSPPRRTATAGGDSDSSDGSGVIIIDPLPLRPTSAPPAAPLPPSAATSALRAIARSARLSAARSSESQAAAQATAAKAAQALAASRYREAHAKALLLHRAGYAAHAAAILRAAPPPPAAPNPGVAFSSPPQPMLPVVGSAAAPPLESSACSDAAVPCLVVSGERLRATLDDLAPGERRARTKSVHAAAKYIPLLTMEQAAEILGCPLSEARSLAPSCLSEDLLIVFGFGWTAGTLDNARLEWQKLSAFAAATAGWRPGARISGYVFRKYLDTRGLRARAAYSRRVAAGIIKARAGDAAGGSVKQSCVRGARFNVRNGRFKIDLACVAVEREAKRSRRRSGRVQPSLSLKMVACLSWHAEHGETEFVRGVAAGVLAMAMLAIRYVNAQRSRIHSSRQGVVRGACDLDAKIGSAEQTGKPFWTSARDVRGSHAWLASLEAALAGVADENFLIRRTNSKDGDPFTASAWRRSEETSGRARCGMRALLTRGPYAVAAAAAAPMGMQSAKRFLPNAARASGMQKVDINEIGAWAGSVAQRARVESEPDAAALAPEHPMAALYSRESADEVVPTIMEAAIDRCRRVIARVGADDLPDVGGWSLFDTFRRSDAY